MPAKLGALLTFLALMTACTTSISSEGSGSPFVSGSIQGNLTGSTDFQVSQTVRDDTGALSAILSYTGTCGRVVADLRLSYRQGDQVVTGEFDHAFRVGPLQPNKPYSLQHQGDKRFDPDAVVFVVSNERCTKPFE